MAKKQDNDTEIEEQDMALVRMVRDEGDAAGGPTVADVHPNEVENYRLGNWRVEK